LRISVREHR
nr:immunoglobulin heavy chain junction region [Mus musculus]